MSAPSTRVWLSAIAGLALVARLGMVALLSRGPLTGDEVNYDHIAGNVAAGRGYVYLETNGTPHPTGARGPGYVLLLAGFYRLFGHHPIVPRAVGALIDVACLLLVYRLALRWFGRPAVGLVAAALYAVYPPLIVSSASLLTETFTQITLLLTIHLFFDFLHQRRSVRLVLSAVSLGLCALAKPQLAPVGIVLCAAAIPRIGLAGALRSAAVVIGVTALTMSPWIVRNALVFHRFVPGLTTSGVNLLLGSGPYGGPVIGGLGATTLPDSVRRAVSRMGDLELDRWAYGETRRVIARDPARYARLTASKFFRLWFNLGYETWPSRSSALLALFNLSAVALALIGARALPADPVAARFMALLAVFWSLVYVPFVAVVRYSSPYYALLFTFTAAGALAVARRISAGPS